MLLTAATYLQSVQGLTPALSYLTLLDKYVLLSSALIALASLEGAISGYVIQQAAESGSVAGGGLGNASVDDELMLTSRPLSDMPTADIWCILVSGGLWFMLHLYVLIVYLQTPRMTWAVPTFGPYFPMLSHEIDRNIRDFDDFSREAAARRTTLVHNKSMSWLTMPTTLGKSGSSVA